MSETVREMIQLIEEICKKDSITFEQETMVMGEKYNIYDSPEFISKFGADFLNHPSSDFTPEVVDFVAGKVGAIRNEEAEKEKRLQRAERGFADIDAWGISEWFLDIIPKMIRFVRENERGYYPVDKNGDFPVLSKEDASLPEPPEVYEKRWDDLLKRMEYLASEACEKTCSMKNPYEEEWSSYHERFDKKYPDKDVLKTPEELEMESNSGFFLDVGPERDEEFGEAYTEICRKFLDYDRKISKYREECKDEFFVLFSKYFFQI